MIRRQYACARWAGLVCACVSAGALAQTAPPPDAQASDPARLGWMVGSPPPADKIVRKEDGSFYRFPQLRWTFSNARQLGATTNVSRGLDSPSALPRAARADRDAVTLVPLGMTEPMTWGQAFDANYTDGVVVLHKGRIVYERYAGVFKPDGQHLAQSLTKSFFGTIAAMLVADGQIDQNALVTQYVPELKGSAFADATVRQVMDMRTGLKYSENYADPKAEIWMHARAGNVLPRPPGYQGPQSVYEVLQTVQKEGEHGGARSGALSRDVRGRVGEDGAEIDRAEQHEHAEDTQRETEIADAVDDEGLDGGSRSRRLLVPEADQQIGRETDAFPAEEHLHEVVGGHQHQHGEGEEAEVGEEARPVGVVGHVADRVEVDQRGDGGHHHQHDDSQRVDAEGPVDLHGAGGEPGQHLDRLHRVLAEADRDEGHPGEDRRDE